MATDLLTDKQEQLQGFASAWNWAWQLAQSMVVRCAIKLKLPDIVAREGSTNTLSFSEIVAHLQNTHQQLQPSRHIQVDEDYLFRVMRLLVAIGILTQTPDHKYGVNPGAKWLLTHGRNARKGDATLASSVLTCTDCSFGGWENMHERVLTGACPWELSSGGLSLWEYASFQTQMGVPHCEALKYLNNVVVRELLEKYRNVFQRISSLVDVGGRKGSFLAQITNAFPNITTAINFDLPNGVAGAPDLPPVRHVAGDAFVSVPSADVILLKNVLHTMGDEECVKVLRNCRNAIPSEGKVVIVEALLLEDGDEVADDDGGDKESERIRGLCFDVSMGIVFKGGKERTLSEWKDLLSRSGLGLSNVICIYDIFYLLEASPCL